MASSEEKLEDLLSCPICLEDFTDTGDTVPRTLPCPHKLCTGCLKKLLEQVKRECPFCRKVLDKDIRSFPQDKFVIAYLKERKEEKREEKGEEKREEKREEKEQAKSTCPKHGMLLILFCTDDKVAICHQCLLESHNGHKFIDIKEIDRQERENLLQMIGTLKTGIAEKKKALEKVKEEIVNKADKSVANLKKEKQKVMDEFNGMIKKVEDSKSKEVNGINSALDTLDNIRVMCDSLSDNTGRESRQELLTKIETLSDIERNATEHVSGAQDFRLCEYQAPELTAEARCGRISEGTITAFLSKGNAPRQVPQPVPRHVHVPREVPGNVPMPVARDVGVKYKVKKRIPVDFTICYDVRPLDATSVLVLGEKQNARTLARVNVQTGEELVSVDLRGWVLRMTTVELGGRKVVALSEGLEEKIDFRDVETLQLISTHSVDPHQPGALCVSSLSTLLFVDYSQEPRKVHILDCSGAKPRHVRVINTEIDWIRDMCVVKNGGEENGGVELLVCVGVTVEGSEIMIFQDLRTGEVKWREDGARFMGGFNPQSVTSGGRDLVYTCDKQNIRTFHVSDGRYLGNHQRALDALQEQGITKPRAVRWNSADSSLVVYHEEYVDGVEKWFISVVRVK